MNRRIAALGLPLAIVVSTLLVLSRPNQAHSDPQAGNAEQGGLDAVGYGIGYFVGEEVLDGMRADGVTVDIEDLVQGFNDAVSERVPVIEHEELENLLAELHDRMAALAAERRLKSDENFRKLAQSNAQASQEMIAEFKKQTGVREIGSGVLVLESTKGAGRVPEEADLVVLSFTVYRADGSILKEADHQESEPRDMIPGARVLLTQMPVGSTWEVVIPSDMAFGPTGDPPAIGPNEALRAEVTLHGIK